MTTAPILCILPASRARRAECARGVLPWRAPVVPPEPDADEDMSLAGLLAAARGFLEDLFRLFGPPEALAARDSFDAVSGRLVADWAGNLAFIVRQLLVVAALALSVDLPPRRARAVAPASTAGARAHRRTLAVALTPTAVDADAVDTGARPGGLAPLSALDGSRPRAQAAPEGQRWARLIAQTATTLEDFDACARRLARCMRRAAEGHAEGLRIAPCAPPATQRRDGGYIPLSRKAFLAWGVAVAATEASAVHDTDLTEQEPAAATATCIPDDS